LSNKKFKLILANQVSTQHRDVNLAQQKPNNKLVLAKYKVNSKKKL